MKDKELVGKYLKQFIASCAYFGYAKGINIQQLVQVYRRIHKSPDGLDSEEILNFLVMLAVSNTYYRDFDEKSRLFIDKALDLVEDQFTGTKHVLAQRPTVGSSADKTSE